MKNSKSAINSFSFLIEQLVRNLNLLDKNEKVCCGITMPQTYTIEAIAGRGRFTMKELSAQMGVAVSTMTRIINVLVRDGIVERMRGSKDRRQVYIELTAKGRELSGKLKCCYEAYIGMILENVPAGKKQDVLEALKVLNDAIGSVKCKCCG